MKKKPFTLQEALMSGMVVVWLIICATLATLKLCGVLTCSWGLATLFFWGPLLMFIATLLFFVLAACAGVLIHRLLK